MYLIIKNNEFVKMHLVIVEKLIILDANVKLEV